MSCVWSRLLIIVFEVDDLNSDINLLFFLSVIQCLDYSMHLSNVSSPLPGLQQTITSDVD